MGVVTAIEDSRRGTRVVSVFVDGERAFDLPARVATALQLAPGDETDDPGFRERLKAEETRAARDVALACVAARELTLVEIRRRLRDRGFSPEGIEAGLEAVRTYGGVDDASLAERLVERKATSLGARRIRSELISRGVDGEMAEEALAGLDQQAQREAAEKLARKKAGSLPGVAAHAVRRKLYDVLARRGFESSVIRAAIETVLQPDPDE